MQLMQGVIRGVKDLQEAAVLQELTVCVQPVPSSCKNGVVEDRIR